LSSPAFFSSSSSAAAVLPPMAAAYSSNMLRTRLCSASRLAPAACGCLPHAHAHPTAPLDALAHYAWLALSLYACAGLLVYCLGVRGSAVLLAPSAAQGAALALASALCSLALGSAAGAVAGWGGRGAWAARYPALAAELGRRRAAAALLARVPTGRLVALVAGAGMGAGAAAGRGWALAGVVGCYEADCLPVEFINKASTYVGCWLAWAVVRVMSYVGLCAGSGQAQVAVTKGQGHPA
jgi:hypothetical protein